MLPGAGTGAGTLYGGKKGGQERAGQEWPAVAHVLAGRTPGTETEQISRLRGRGLPPPPWGCRGPFSHLTLVP